MLLKHKKFKNEKGFAIALALLMLVVMSLMGATLMVVEQEIIKEILI